jgi:NADPH-dependent ferric siderophore reductase
MSTSVAPDTGTDTRPPSPFGFFDDLTTVRRTRLSPTMTRVTVGGDSLRDFASGGLDQRVKLLLPQDGQDAPVLPGVRGDGWYQSYLAQPAQERAIMRTYTVRAVRPEARELDIDFALHGDTGPASRWATRTEPGDRLALWGSRVADNGGLDFRPTSDAKWLLITGDETALPAIGGILEALPAGRPTQVFLEVPDPADRQNLHTEAEVEITWLIREHPGTAHGSLVLDAVRAAALPDGEGYAWIAGEAASVRTLRRHLVQERGHHRKSVNFTGYWRKGKTEDEPAAPGELHE